MTDTRHQTKADISDTKDEFKARFDKLDKRIDDFEKRVDQKFDDFEKRVDVKINKAVTDLSEVISDFSNQVANEFIKTNKRIDRLQKDMDFIMNQLDAITKKQEIDDDERLVIGHHLDRVDKWVHELADKIGYELKV